MEDNLINYKNDNGKEIIEIDYNNLLEFQENHDVLPLRVNDKQKFLKWFENHLREMFSKAYTEEGASWLEGNNY